MKTEELVNLHLIPLKVDKKSPSGGKKKKKVHLGQTKKKSDTFSLAFDVQANWHQNSLHITYYNKKIFTQRL